MTQLIWEDARSVITANDSPDIAFDLSINPDRGCEHGCAYCYARPTHSYLGLSSGLDFETRIITTLDGRLARQLEPRAAAPHRRLCPGLPCPGLASVHGASTQVSVAKHSPCRWSA